MRHSITTEGSETLVTIDGPLNETAKKPLADLVANLKVGPVRFDCAHVSSINSVGAKLWMDFIADLGKKGLTSLRFERCSTIFVDFANMIPAFLGKGQLTSLYIPYLCQNCGHSHDVYSTCDALSPDKDFTPYDCPNCSESMNARVGPEDYLLFLA